jgi:predicted branched-subunit amino acid permease
MKDETSPKVNQGFAYGLRQSLTIVIGYAPVAVTFGILATQFGLTFWEAGLMSFFVYAGAAQFIAIEMIHQGATMCVILKLLIPGKIYLILSVALAAGIGAWWRGRKRLQPIDQPDGHIPNL